MNHNDKEGPMKKPILSYILIGINVAVYAVLMVLAGFDTGVYGDLLLRYGAKINGNIVAGEYWRLITAMFLHGGFVHLLLNSVSLNAIGTITENVYGRKRFIVIYFAAGILGNLSSLCFSAYPGVGASGAIFGLLGAMLYLGVKNPDFMRSGFGKDILVLAVINLAYGFTASGIDNFAHLGGLVGGFLTTGILISAVERFPLNSRVVSALVLALLTAGATWYGFTKALNIQQSYISTLMDLEAAEQWDAMQVYGIGRLKELPADSAVRSDILYYVVRSAAVQGDYPTAEKYSREMAALEPAFGNYLLSLVLFDQAKYAEATEALEKSEAAGYDADRIKALREKIKGIQ